jgi:Ankyrin repeat
MLNWCSGLVATESAGDITDSCGLYVLVADNLHQNLEPLHVSASVNVDDIWEHSSISSSSLLSLNLAAKFLQYQLSLDLASDNCNWNAAFAVEVLRVVVWRAVCVTWVMLETWTHVWPWHLLMFQDGFTALTIAAKEGYTDIASLLLQHDAYVNLPDRVCF